MGLFTKKTPHTAGEVDRSRLPRHIAVIMDGNGRWAKKRGLPRTAGHKVGAEVFRDIATYCKELGVEYLTVYAFSTENTIMGLLEQYLHEAIDTMEKDHIRLRFFGDMSVLSPELQALAHRTDDISAHYDGFQANICLNFGGRAVLLRAAQRCAERGLDWTEENLSANMYSAGIPDPELVIRPGGEMRLSNFLLWQCAYSELYFCDTLWPDFTRQELDKAIIDYQRRDRRFGGVK